MSEFSFDRDVLPVVKRLAQVRFAKDQQRQEKVNDCLSVAWEFYRNAKPAATAQSIGWYAIRRVLTGRQFRESIRSTTGPASPHCPKPKPTGFDPGLIFDDRDDPARIAECRIDTALFLRCLNPRQRRLAKMLAVGVTPNEAAQRFGVTQSAISQQRKKMYEIFQSLTE